MLVMKNVKTRSVMLFRFVVFYPEPLLKLALGNKRKFYAQHVSIRLKIAQQKNSSARFTAYIAVDFQIILVSGADQKCISRLLPAQPVAIPSRAGEQAAIGAAHHTPT